MRRGIAVSPGVATGTAYCILEIYVNPDRKRLEDREITAELARFETARDLAAHDLQMLCRKVEHQLGRSEAAIFGVHEAILRDTTFTAKVRRSIVDERLTAPAALHRLLLEYTELFSASGDAYWQERLSDLRDVIVRLSSHLSDVVNVEQPALEGPLIIVADELLPSHVVALGDADVVGIVTERGSQTSHAAIIARSRGIPAVSGVSNITKQVRSGDMVVVDGRDGVVSVNPDPESLAAYRKLAREFVLLKDDLAANRDVPARTSDHRPLELLANINGVLDVPAAVNMGANGVGLFRTEYLYLTHPDIPSEEEQTEVYRAVIEAAPGRTITIRTLDIGGDKTVPYLGHTHQEANPFMGWRSIRLSFQHPEFFNVQIRAILRAAHRGQELGKQVRILFPMITILEEMRRVRRMVGRAAKQLTIEKLPHAMVPIGMMLEVPAAAISIRTLLKSADFVSIGSNDLVQYLMAADRDNPKVSHLCQPLSPPVLHVLRDVIAACTAANKPVTLCGELAGQPRGFLVLLGMGLTCFSMSPSFIPSIKELASHITQEQAESVLAKALTMTTTAQTHRYLGDQIKTIAPNLTLLDTA